MHHADAGHPDADRGPNPFALPDQAQHSNPLTDALGHIQRAQQVGVRQVDHQHAATKPRQQVVGPQRGRGQPGDLDQHRIAAGRAVLVIEALEVVHIHHQQGRVLAVAADARPLAVGGGNKVKLGVGAGQGVTRRGLGVCGGGCCRNRRCRSGQRPRPVGRLGSRLGSGQLQVGDSCGRVALGQRRRHQADRRPATDRHQQRGHRRPDQRATGAAPGQRQHAGE